LFCFPEHPLQSEWERLFTTYRVFGKSTHDARLAAAMMVHGVGSLLTFNLPDFVRYPNISVINPATVA
jgi:hypothetical protein